MLRYRLRRKVPASAYFSVWRHGLAEAARALAGKHIVPVIGQVFEISNTARRVPDRLRKRAMPARSRSFIEAARKAENKYFSTLFGH